MGPRSEDRGYRRRPRDLCRSGDGFNGSTVRGPWLSLSEQVTKWLSVIWLQWVHGPRTVVIGRKQRHHDHGADASMGPRSEDRGYRHRAGFDVVGVDMLQWVHGPRTVVIALNTCNRSPA